MSKVVLRDIRLGDADSLVKYGNNLKIWNNMRDYFPNPYKKEDAMFFVDKVNNSKTETAFAISKDDELIGVVGYNLQGDIYHHSAEIGYWIGEPFWGQGITTDALRQAVDHAFNVSKVKRLYTSVFENNIASTKVLENAGFVFEGRGIKSVLKNEEYLDELRYSLLNPNYFPSNNQ